MGFRSSGSEGNLGRSRSYSTLPESLVKLEPPPFNPVRTAKRSSWAAAPPCKQKVDALPVTQGGYEKGHDGGLLLAGKKGGWLHGWRKEVRLTGRALVALALTVLVVTAVLPSLSHLNQVRFCVTGSLCMQGVIVPVEAWLWAEYWLRDSWHTDARGCLDSAYAAR